jgi:hypothetical protein
MNPPADDEDGETPWLLLANTSVATLGWTWQQHLLCCLSSTCTCMRVIMSGFKSSSAAKCLQAIGISNSPELIIGTNCNIAPLLLFLSC